MIKRILCIAVMVLAIACLAGCTQSPEATQPQTQSEEIPQNPVEFDDKNRIIWLWAKT